MSLGLAPTCPVLTFQCPIMPESENHAVVLGIYQSVDPSTYSDVYPEAPNERIREIADLFGDLYRLLIDMRYIDARMVNFPPHKHQPIDITKAAALGLTKDVVDMYQMIPYHPRYLHRFGVSNTNWNFGSDGGELIKWGESLHDLRGPEGHWWQVACDPFYALPDLNPEIGPERRAADADTRGWDHEEGPYMRPWYVTLSDCGNHGSVMVLDTKTYQMWLIDQLGGGTTDPFFNGLPPKAGAEPKNRMDLNQYRSRDAADFLRDMISRFQGLKWIPGGLYGPDHTYFNQFRELYQECGWPDKFNPIEFDAKYHDGGERFDYHVPREEPTPEELAYEPLQKFYNKMSYAKEDIKYQIELVDAEYRLKHELYKDKWERERYENDKRRAEHIMNPDFERENRELKTLLDFLKSDLEAMRTRTGRYAGRGWAGVSDEELQALYEKTVKKGEVPKIEALLKDETQQDRLEREFREAKAAALAVPAEAWDNMATKYAEWENAEPDPLFPRRGTSVLGSGRTVQDLRSVIDEDMTLEELKTRIVELFEKEKPEDLKNAERIWRVHEGKIAMVEEAPEKTEGTDRTTI
ncbi:hypothetical protein F5Y16DRAFT_381649 [Xylariaceae sp. FL0255]|nr:hypothetical protein F5Y16DRAFT_381649 [Xylariaceae sp. FL0255]